MKGLFKVRIYCYKLSNYSISAAAAKRTSIKTQLPLQRLYQTLQINLYD